MGLIHTKQKAESQTQTFEFYLIVYALKASTLHYTSKHGWSAGSPIKRSKSLYGFRDPDDRVAERLEDGRRDLDLCKRKKHNIQSKRWCQTIKRLHKNMKGANGNSRRVPSDICNHQRLTCSTLLRRWPVRRFVALLLLHGLRLKATGDRESSFPHFLVDDIRHRLCQEAFHPRFP